MMAVNALQTVDPLDQSSLASTMTRAGVAAMSAAGAAPGGEGAGNKTGGGTGGLSRQPSGPMPSSKVRWVGWEWGLVRVTADHISA
jgi:hypothetical protein